MSSRSLSFTFPNQPAIADEAAAAIWDGDLWPLDGYNTDYFFCTSSRGNWLEYQVFKLIQEFKPTGLDYLSGIFRDKGRPASGWYAAALHGEALDQAINGLLSLTANPRRGFAETIDFVADGWIDDSEIQLINNKPTSISDAVTRYETYCRDNDGDDHPTLITFLQGHLCALQYAQDNSLAAVYALWIE